MFDDLDDLIFWGVLAAGALTFLGILVFKPRLFLRIPLRLGCHAFYRLRAFGRENVPATGPALLVCNHVSYLDFFFLLAAQKRHIHFVIFAGWTKIWGLRRILRWAGVIPIDKWGGPRSIVKSLKEAADRLKHGDLVCIFAEGRFTRTGFLLPFHRGFEQILKHHAAPIIPVCVDQTWGSIFSFWGGKLIWKWPNEFRYPVTVAFGKPMPETTPAAEVRLAIQKLSAECAMERTPRRRLVHQQFVRMASKRPWRKCLINAEGSLSYSKTLVQAMGIAKQLHKRVADADVIAVWMPHGRNAIFANLAIAFLRKTTINLDSSTAAEQIEAVVRRARCKHILSSRAFLSPGISGVETIFVEDLLAEVSAIQTFRRTLAVLLLPRIVVERSLLGLGKHRSGDAATIMPSSGSSLVVLNHGNLSADASSIIQGIVPTSRDRFLAVLPLSNRFGYMANFWLPLQVGAAIVLPKAPPSAGDLGKLVRQHGCTVLLAPAGLLRECLDACDAADFASLRLLWTGGEGLRAELVDAFKAKFGIAPLEGYGRAELGPIAAINVPDATLEGFKQIGNKPGTIGQPLPGIAARIVHPETFEPLPSDQEGMLLMYGPNIMAGYLDNPEETKKVFHDGWYITGDRAKYDDDGFITLITDDNQPLPSGSG